MRALLLLLATLPSAATAATIGNLSAVKDPVDLGQLNDTNTAFAFGFDAVTSGTVKRVSMYVHATASKSNDTPSTLRVGLQSANASGDQPSGTWLGGTPTVTSNSGVAAGWQGVDIPNATVVAGTRYFLVVESANYNDFSFSLRATTPHRGRVPSTQAATTRTTLRKTGGTWNALTHEPLFVLRYVESDTLPASCSAANADHGEGNAYAARADFDVDATSTPRQALEIAADVALTRVEVLLDAAVTGTLGSRLLDLTGGGSTVASGNLSSAGAGIFTGTTWYGANVSGEPLLLSSKGNNYRLEVYNTTAVANGKWVGATTTVTTGVDPVQCYPHNRVTYGGVRAFVTEKIGGGVHYDRDQLFKLEVCDKKTWWKDADGDGFGVSSDTKLQCSQPNGYVPSSAGEDCNDAAATTYPGAPELCDDVDQDCDSTKDNNVSATTAPACTNQKGVCAGSKRSVCASGAWSECTAANFGPNYEPTETRCDDKDNDCDGQKDALGDVTCGSGPCANTVAKCVAGVAQTCTPKPAGTESCANPGVDDDCDGDAAEIANGVKSGDVCSTGKPGICSAGAAACGVNGRVCVQATAAGTESCNGLDDDCDGTPDDGSLCDDGNPCTDDACVAGGCKSTVAAGRACDDGLSCTTSACDAAGLCAGAYDTSLGGCGLDTSKSTLAVSPSTVPADGTSAAKLAATLKNSSGEPFPAADVAFDCSFGALSPAASPGRGIFTASLTAAAPGIATCAARSGGQPLGTVEVRFVATAITLSLTADPATAEPGASVTLSATLANDAKSTVGRTTLRFVLPEGLAAPEPRLSWRAGELSGTAGDGGAISFELPSIEPEGGSASFVVQLTGSAASSLEVRAQAFVGGDPASNEALATVAVFESYDLGGCGCASATATTGPLPWVLAALLSLRRHRRRSGA